MEEIPFSKVISLISEIHYDASDFLRLKLASQGLTDVASSHGNILYQLSLYKSVTMKDLSKKINKNKSTMTALIKKLEKAGYVERTQSAADNRVWFISLTANGEKFVQPTALISYELIETCYRGFSEEEKGQLNGLLQKMAQNFKK